MQRTDFGAMACSIARTLHVAGEPWSPLIMRDVYVGIARFDDLLADLGISRKVLTQRLAWLVDQRMLERRRYSERPPRSEYVLTEKGLAFCDVLIVMTAWGDRWAAGDDGPPVLHRHRACGQVTHAQLCCDRCGRPLTAADIDIEPGPGARS
ncbi:MAG: helix-turn-helix domain-containing protein [Actinomycetota bacterium]|nr:helix-turn-helix domain-containing protein [Actinomycetota bacterium]